MRMMTSEPLDEKSLHPTRQIKNVLKILFIAVLMAILTAGAAYVFDAMWLFGWSGE
jgi:hypothetical protein